MDISYYKSLEPLFGSWHITKLIGEGSFGKVFEIERKDETLGRSYKAALKVISIPYTDGEVESLISEGMTEDSATDYFKEILNDVVDEYDLMAKLKGNSYIVSCEDYVVIPKKTGIGWDILIRMELLNPLVRKLNEGELSEAETIKLGIDLCRALESCQKYNIIHRDIKPENIFISELGEYKLGDFGIARTAEKTTSGMSKKGTFTYMAPEVYLGASYGKSVDIYSVGLVMYRLLNKNRAPFFPPYPEVITYAKKENALRRRMSGETIPLPINGSDELKKIVMKASAFAPSDRFSSPMQMRQELEALLNQKKYEATQAEDPTEIIDNNIIKNDFYDEDTIGLIENDASNTITNKNEVTESLTIKRQVIDDDKTLSVYDSSNMLKQAGDEYANKKEPGKKEPDKKVSSIKALIIVCILILLFVGIALLFLAPKLKSGDNKQEENGAEIIETDRSDLMFIMPTDEEGNLNYSYKIDEAGNLVYDQNGMHQYELLYDIEYIKSKGLIILTGNDVESAEAGEISDNNYGVPSYIVSIKFDDEGAIKFEEATRKVSENEGFANTIAIYYDGKIISCPYVNQPIMGNEAQIFGLNSMDEAQELADYLNGKVSKSVKEQVDGESNNSGNVSLEDTVVYETDQLTIALKPDESGFQKYCIVKVVIAVDSKNPDYEKRGDLYRYMSFMQDEIVDVIGSKTYDEAIHNQEQMKQEILIRLQEKFESDFIYKVNFSEILFS